MTGLFKIRAMDLRPKTESRDGSTQAFLRVFHDQLSLGLASIFKLQELDSDSTAKAQKSKHGLVHIIRVAVEEFNSR